ncbi:hypothetical protein CP8484711_2301, partial [Chlamydia psittaci 84-8471/1]
TIDKITNVILHETETVSYLLFPFC